MQRCFKTKERSFRLEKTPYIGLKDIYTYYEKYFLLAFILMVRKRSGCHDPRLEDEFILEASTAYITLCLICSIKHEVVFASGIIIKHSLILCVCFIFMP